MCRRRSDSFDRAIKALAGRSIGDGMALLAVGGYGRRELAPGSDIDLLFLHRTRTAEALRLAVDAVLYPLWDAGVRVSHAVRTPEECREEARKALPTLASLLDMRLLDGERGLFEEARQEAAAIAQGDPASFAGRLLAEQMDRDLRVGTMWRTMHPDLKEGVGGLRDVQVVRWIHAARGVGAGGAAGPREDLEEALDLLLRARVALHGTAGWGSNLLAPEHHAAVAASLGYVDADGWESRDALMRDVFAAGRRIHAASLDLAGGESQPARPSSLDGWLRDSSHEPQALRHPMATDTVASFDGVASAWARVKGRVQRDPYHRYPVDVHLIETAAEAGRLLHDPQEAFDVEAVRPIGDPLPLLVGALLHDIGKVGAGSHIQRGTEIARGILDRMGVDSAAREDVLFLVSEHLLLSNTATRRNLEDEDLIVQVAASIGDRRRLAMLYLLTVADAVATGPGASTPWRMTLVRDLVAKVDHVFERGQMDRDRAGRLRAAESAIRDALLRGGSEEDRIAPFLATVPSGYLLWVVPAMAVHHVGLVVPSPGGAEARVDIRTGRSSGTYGVAVGAVDRLGLLTAVAGSFSLAGLTILSAHAFTTEGGIALDVFEVRGAFEDDVDERRWDRFRGTLDDALNDRIDLGERIRSLRSHYRLKGTGIIPTVTIDERISDFFTVVEVGARDRLGLLFDLARTFSDHGLDVHVAKVATYGPRVVDVFYVQDGEGQKLENPGDVADLVGSLIAAGSGG